MSAYSGDPATSDKDQVRFEIGDTAAPMHFTDAEILARIALKGDWGLAAADLCFIWSRWLARQPDFTLGAFSEKGNQEAARILNEKGTELQALYGGTTTGLYAGGVSVADNDTIAADTDRPTKDFRRGQFGNPDA